MVIFLTNAGVIMNLLSDGQADGERSISGLYQEVGIFHKQKEDHYLRSNLSAIGNDQHSSKAR